MGSIVSQDQYLYTTRFHKKAVDLVIETLSTEALYGSWDYPGNIHTGLIKAKKSLDKEFKAEYSYKELFEVVDMLKQRFTIWKSLSDNPDVMINKFTKSVLATPTVWERLVKADERVKWYAYKGETAYADLEVIFENPWKGKDEFIHLGEVSGLHKVPARFDELEIEPLPTAHVPPLGRTCIDEYSPVRTVANDARNDETFSPNPQGTPSLRIITKEDYEKSLSAKSTKTAKRLFVAPNSPSSSAGSSSRPMKSTFQKIKAKFDKSG